MFKLSGIIDGILDTVCSHKCPGCGEIIGYRELVCSDECRKKFDDELITEKICLDCARPIKECSCKGRVFMYSAAIAPFRYDGIAGEKIVAFKRELCSEYTEFFADYMIAYAKEKYDISEFDAVCAVPMSKHAIIHEGFDHSGFLARAIADKLDLPYIKALKQVKDAESQHTLSFDRRRENVKGIYKTVKKVEGMNILLVDDVMTSGSTFSECAKTLRLSGAEDVKCIAFTVACKKHL